MNSNRFYFSRAGRWVLTGAALTATLQWAPQARSADATSAPKATFSKDIAPILQRSCQSCHHAGSIAPMSLMTYSETRPWARSIRERVVNREMPPWYVDRTVGIHKFKDDPSLSDTDVAKVANWVANGAPEGDPKDLPQPLTFSDDNTWHIGKPDVIIKPDKVLAVGAASPDQWVDMDEIETGLTEDRYIQAVESRPALPNAQKVVHHATTSMSFPGKDGGLDSGGFLNEYAVGKNADVFPEGTGRLIKAGTKIHMNVHLHSVGQPIDAQVEVGLKLYPKGYVPKHVIIAEHVGDSFDSIDIPANSDNARADGYFLLTRPAQVVSFQPHMHNRGSRECVEAIYPNGKVQTLNCAKHNFAWMLAYTYDEDVAPLLPANTTLHIISWYDNTTKNKYNPDPNNWVGFGNRSVDDMSFAWMNIYYLSPEEYQQRLKDREKGRGSE
jgi:hypothetical protein